MKTITFVAVTLAHTYLCMCKIFTAYTISKRIFQFLCVCILQCQSVHVTFIHVEKYAYACMIDNLIIDN